jgi:hypothetical protein
MIVVGAKAPTVETVKTRAAATFIFKKLVLNGIENWFLQSRSMAPHVGCRRKLWYLGSGFNETSVRK